MGVLEVGGAGALAVRRARRSPVTISPGFSAVVKRSTKNFSAGILRAPFGPLARTVAPRATRTVGKSAAGSAWAIEPPMVPRLRTWRSPIWAAASASTGQDFRTSAEAAISACVVVAPISSALPFAWMPESPLMPARSTSAFGVASRNFMAGSRLWPPARSRAPLCFFRSCAASASVFGRK